MARLLLNTIALDPHRWTAEKVPYHRLGALLPSVAAAGFRFVELWQYHVSREPPAAVRQLRRQADDLGLRLPVVGLYPRLHLDGPAQQQAMDEVEKILEYAGLLGAEIVKLFVGCKGTEAITEAEYDRSIAFLMEMAARARSRGLTLTGETHADTLFDSVGACRAVLRAVAADHLKVCFQPYDLADTRQALADYHALRRHVVHVHYQGRRAGRMELLEHADLDYRALTAALADGGFDGYVCIEFVKDCVVEDPARFNLDRVLLNAQRDRDFVVAAAKACGMALSV